MVGWSFWVYGEVHKVLPTKDDWMSKFHQRRVTDCSCGGWGGYQLATPLMYQPQTLKSLSPLLISSLDGEYWAFLIILGTYMTPVMKILKSVPVSSLRGWSTLLVFSITFGSAGDLNISTSLESHRHVAKNTKSTHIAAGDVVIVHDESLPRGLWTLGRIQEVILGADGLRRCAVVQVATRDKQHTLLKRPVQLLYPLEISQPEHPDDTSGCTPSAQPQSEELPGTCEPLETCGPVRRPIRAAAKKAAEKRRIWVEELQSQDWFVRQISNIFSWTVNFA